MLKKPGPCHVFVPVRQGLANSVIDLQLIPAFLFSHFQWRVNYFFVFLWHKLVYGMCVSVCCVHFWLSIGSSMRVGNGYSYMSIAKQSDKVKYNNNWSSDERLLFKITITLCSTETMGDGRHASYFFNSLGRLAQDCETHGQLASSGWEAVNLSWVKHLNVWGASLEAHAVWIAVQIPAESQINSDGKMRCHKEFIIPPLK